MGNTKAVGVAYSDPDLDSVTVSGNATVSGSLIVGGNTISSAELGFLDGVTAGTATASKAVVLDGSKGIATITSATITTVTTGTVTSNAASLAVGGLAAAQGGAIAVTGGTSSTSGNAGGAVTLTGGTPGATGAGGAVALVGAAGGATSGSGGNVTATAGAGTAGNANGGSVVLTPGAKNGSGFDGMVIVRGQSLFAQGAPTAKTVSATLTAAEVLTGIITVNQGAAGASALQLPLASAMDTGFPNAAAGDSFDFSVINISTVDAEDASLTTNTGWTLVGNMDIPAYSAAGSLNSSGLFRARKTGTAAWTLYRIG